MGIEPTSSAWKAEVLPLNYTRCRIMLEVPTWRPSWPSHVVEGGGFEPPKAEPSDLQSDPFDHSGTPPNTSASLSLAGERSVNTRPSPEITTLFTPARGAGPRTAYQQVPPLTPIPARAGNPRKAGIRASRVRDASHSATPREVAETSGLTRYVLRTAVRTKYPCRI